VLHPVIRLLCNRHLVVRALNARPSRAPRRPTSALFLPRPIPPPEYRCSGGSPRTARGSAAAARGHTPPCEGRLPHLRLHGLHALVDVDGSGLLHAGDVFGGLGEVEIDLKNGGGGRCMRVVRASIC
jgi:hypothetical protein